jgi:competence ComEA-like helix-hairpin-helix protein
MQSNIRKIKSHYFNISTLILHECHLVFLTFCLLLFNGCRPRTKNLAETIKNEPVISANAVNLNTGSAGDLEKLPRIGTELARKIVEHREKYGRFRRVEHLILVKGMSDKKFRDIRNFVKTE